MSFPRRSSKRQRTEAILSQSSLSELVSIWRERFSRQGGRPRATGEIFRAGGTLRRLGGPGAAGLRARASDSAALDYSADLEEETTDDEPSWSPKVIFALTAIMGLFLIGSLAIFLVNDGVIGNRWSSEFEEDAVEAVGSSPKVSSPPAEAQAVTATTAPPSRKPPTHRSTTIGASKAEQNSTTSRSDVHHGPRFFGNRAASYITQTTTEEASVTEGTAETREASADSEEVEERKHDVCSVALHVYCVKVRDEFYYQPSMNTCVMTATDRTVVCNHSRNKYLSHDHCRKSCVEGAVPSEKCFQTATFSMCTRRDVRHKWWFFNGSHCQPWDFPLGACPSHTDADGGDAFDSYSECAQTCVPGHKPLLRRCQRPVNEPCTAQQLRFPYFAVGVPKAGSGVFRCVKASGAVLAHHRCATGENRFHTRDACARRCYRED